jgi:DNA-binding CsgD family transcriptional regulator
MLPIEHPFGDLDLPPKIPDERLQQLVKAVREGVATQSEFTELALGHIRLACSIAVNYANGVQHVGEELINEAVFGLVIALSKAREKLRDDNITPFCVSYMRKHILAYLYQSSMVPVPYSTLKRRERQGANIVVPGYTSDTDMIPDIESNLDHVKEEIQKAIKNDFEREVIQRRALGYNDREIAEQLNEARHIVNNAKRAVWHRYRGQ